MAFFKFVYDKRTFIVSNGFASTNQPYAIGDKAQILIDPHHPGKGYILADKELKNYYKKASQTQDRKTNFIGMVALVAFYIFFVYIVCYWQPKS